MLRIKNLFFILLLTGILFGEVPFAKYVLEVYEQQDCYFQKKYNLKPSMRYEVMYITQMGCGYDVPYQTTLANARVLIVEIGHSFFRGIKSKQELKAYLPKFFSINNFHLTLSFEENEAERSMQNQILEVSLFDGVISYVTYTRKGREVVLKETFKEAENIVACNQAVLF